MPTYEYLCQKCDVTFEVFQSMKDDPLKVCTCGKKGKVKRLLGTGAGIIFKGSGFYETDYKRASSKPADGKSEGTGAAKNGGTAAGASTPAPASPPAASPKQN